MGQRSIRKTMSPIGVTSRGIAVFALCGAEPEGDDPDKTGKEGEDPDVSGGTGGTDTGGGTGGDPAKGEGETISKEEFESLKARMQAADKRADEAAKKVKEYEDKDKSELEKATGRVTELETALADKDKVISDLRFDNAFALNPKFSWHDPQVVLDLVKRRDDVTIEADGTIKGLDKALDAVAKEKPFLVKSDDGESGGDGKHGASGSGTGSGKKNDGKQVDKDALAKKYPALNL